MHIKHLKPMHCLALGLVLSLTTTQSIAAPEYKLSAVGTSAHDALRNITSQAHKGLLIKAPDATLKDNIAADTAYSAVRQIADDAGYKVLYQDNTFTVVPLAAKAAAPVTNKTTEHRAEKFSLTLRDTPIQEAFEMLAKRGRINLLLAPDVTGVISANLYDIDLMGAVESIAKISGLSVSHNKQGIYISGSNQLTTAALQKEPEQVQSFKVQYSDISSVESIMREYLSSDGSLTSLPKRNLIIVRDKTSVVRQLKSLLKEIDMPPRQIMIEAKILEITLTDEETFGIDWQAKRGNDEFGTLSLAKRETAGMFLNVVSSNLNAYLSALSSTGRVRTLSTPKLLVLEDQSAEVIVGDKLGFRVTSINGNTTTESVEFLESGIILRVEASVDGQDRILLDVHPEVSNGSLVGGLPVQKTTEVNTSLLAKSGQEVFIGGLLRRTSTKNEAGVPGISKVPLIGALFKKSEDTGNRTETVVIIKPSLVEHSRSELEPMAELLDSDDWFYENLPAIDVLSGCVNNRCGY